LAEFVTLWKNRHFAHVEDVDKHFFIWLGNQNKFYTFAPAFKSGKSYYN